MKALSFIRLFILIVLVAFLTTVSLAQEATILGTITDPTGAAVPNVKVTLTNTDTGITTTVTSSEDGQYVAPDIHIGFYVVRAEATGFKVGEQQSVKLQVGDRTRVDFKLQIGSTRDDHGRSQCRSRAN